MSFVYRKKPVEVEAFQFDSHAFHNDETQMLPQWFISALANQTIRVDETRWGVLAIDTLEGPLYVQDKDWIIKGTADELYPCKPEIFANIYEKVGE